MQQLSFRQLFFLFFISSVIVQSQELVFIQELFRHGARGPFSPYWDGNDQLNIKGELTPTGYRQHFLLGRQLRKEYIEERSFLSSSYNWQEIYVRSTDVNRTIQSANCQLMGLYPKGPLLPTGLPDNYKLPPFEGVQDLEELGNFALPHQLGSIPVHVIDEMHDLELQPWNFCDNYVEQTQIFKDEHQRLTEQFNKNFTKTFQHLSKALNQTINSYDQIGGVWGGVYDVFVADEYNHRPLPSSLTKEDLDNIKFMDSFSWFYGDFGTDLGTKQLNTPFFKMLIDNFDKKRNNTFTDLKWMMFSAHDSNVAMSMRALNISNYECLLEKYFTNSTSYLNCEFRPNFASSIIWELYRNTSLPSTSDDSQYYIKIRYDGKYVHLCEKKSQECSYQEFKQRISNYVLPNFQESCQGKVQINNFAEKIMEKTIEKSVVENPLFKFVLIETVVITLLCFALGKFYAERKREKIILNKQDYQQFINI